MDRLCQRLLSNQKTIFTAESCTAGLLASSLADYPGISPVLLGGIICYNNRIKTDLLGVKEETLKQEGAVSFACCEEMLQGALSLSHADYVCAITGIAGPEGGTPQKPLGTVFIGVLSKEGGIMLRLQLTGTRQDIRTQSAQFTANLVASWEEGSDFASLFIQDAREICPPF